MCAAPRWLVVALFCSTALVAALCGSACEGVAQGDEAIVREGIWSQAVAARSTRGHDGGRFSLLTYNIAGLPQAISPSNPHANTPLISPLLNTYDVVLVQEDFIYHDALISSAAHAHRSRPLHEQPSVLSLGDGLNQLSQLPMDETLVREPWTKCSGTFSHAWDCRAEKGFSVTRLELVPGGPVVTLVNLHMDAGSKDPDRAVRREQVAQLVAWLEANLASDAPLIVAGDTNLNTDHPYDRETFATLLEATGLSDACVAAARDAEAAADCEGPRRIDKVLFRSGREVELDAVQWREPTEFVDASQRALSDHEPVAVEFDWTLPRLAGR